MESSEPVLQDTDLGPDPRLDANVSNSVSTTSPAPPSSTGDRQRREALRKAGADFLEQAMQQKQAGSPDPFAPVAAPLSSTSNTSLKDTRASGSSRRRLRQQALPEDVAAFGQLFESTKLYVYCGIYFACQASIFALVKVRLRDVYYAFRRRLVHQAVLPPRRAH